MGVVAHTARVADVLRRSVAATTDKAVHKTSKSRHSMASGIGCLGIVTIFITRTCSVVPSPHLSNCYTRTSPVAVEVGRWFFIEVQLRKHRSTITQRRRPKAKTYRTRGWLGANTITHQGHGSRSTSARLLAVRHEVPRRHRLRLVVTDTRTAIL